MKLKNRFARKLAVCGCALVLAVGASCAAYALAEGSAWDGTTVDTTWEGSGTEDDPYILSTAEELAGMNQTCTASNNWYKDTYFELGDDIDLNNKSWTPIAHEAGSDAGFAGCFNGACYTISGLNVHVSGNGVGLFGYVDGADLGNFVVKGTCSLSNANYAGGVVGCVRGDTCLYNIGNEVNVSGRAYVGGLIGGKSGSDDVEIDLCYNKGSVYASFIDAGGLVGAYAAGDLKIYECYNWGSVSMEPNDSGEFLDVMKTHMPGGLVGNAYNGDNNYIIITDSYNAGSVSVSKGDSLVRFDWPYRVGGLIGSVDNESYQIENSYFAQGVLKTEATSGTYYDDYAVGTVLDETVGTSFSFADGLKPNTVGRDYLCGISYTYTVQGTDYEAALPLLYWEDVDEGVHEMTYRLNEESTSNEDKYLFYCKNCSYSRSADGGYTEGEGATVGSATIAPGNCYAPWKQYSYNSATGMIYHASEISKTGDLSSISFCFKAAESALHINYMRIYLGTTSADSWGAGTAAKFTTTDDLTLMYEDTSGTSVLNCDTDGWQTFQFNKGKFHYDGTKNLVVYVVTDFSDRALNTPDVYMTTVSDYPNATACVFGDNNSHSTLEASTQLSDSYVVYSDTRPDMKLGISVCSHSALLYHKPVDSTCTTPFVRKYYECVDCGRLFTDANATEETTLKDVTGWATGHNWGATTYEWSDDGAVCYAQRICTNDPSHIERVRGIMEMDQTTYPATCTTAGKHICTAYFPEHPVTEWATQQVKEVDVPATGHAFNNYVSNNDATCTEDGTKTGTCAYCGASDTITDTGSKLGHNWGKYTSNNDATCAEDGTKTAKCYRCDATDTVTDEGTALGHDWGEYTSNDDATCTADGTKTRTCSRCDATDTATDEGTALGHAWGEVTYTWSSDYSSCTAHRECARDASHNEDVAATVTRAETTVATCTEDGVMTYTATFGEEGLETQIKTATITATGHKWGTPERYVAGGKWYCTRSCTNTNCQRGTTKKVFQEDIGVEAFYKTIKEPTCTEQGEKMFTVTFTEEWATPYNITEADNRFEVVPALGHDWGEYESNDDATCTKDGTKTRVCSRCEEEDTVADEGSALGHDLAHADAQDPTCTESGYAAYDYCQRCDYSTRGNEIPALDHDWGEPTPLSPATCEEDATYQVSCSRCEAVEMYSDAGTALGHSWGDWKVTKAATIGAEGEKERACERCGETETATIDALVEPTEAQKNAEAKAAGYAGTESTVTKAITGSKNDEGFSGAVYAKLQVKVAKTTKSSIKLTWKKVAGATKYMVFGNRCGAKNSYKLIKTLKGSSTVFKKLAKGKYYKYLVMAVDSQGRVITVAKAVHVATAGGKVCNAKSVKTAAKKSKVTLKKGKTFKLKAKTVAASKKLKLKKHRTMRYETSNAAVATVSAKGVVKAKKKGTCYVYAYAQNGVCAKVKVTIK